MCPSAGHESQRLFAFLATEYRAVCTDNAALSAPYTLGTFLKSDSSLKKKHALTVLLIHSIGVIIATQLTLSPHLPT